MADKTILWTAFFVVLAGGYGPRKTPTKEPWDGINFFLDLEGKKQLEAIDAAWNHRTARQPE
jgi:hypothetical protein